jgi:putative dimethyl sulfoxide reductase chaperone
MNDGQDVVRRLFEALAVDIRWLARLHGNELDAPMCRHLLSETFPENLVLLLDGESVRAAVELTRGALRELGEEPSPEALEALAADYAGIYLNYSFRASPSESVWIDEDQLAMQGPMFEVREWMGRHGLAVANWRVCPEDHLVHELEFLAYLLESGAGAEDFSEASDFMDRHLLRWAGAFCRRVAARCETSFYAGLNALTGHYLEELRDLLAEVTGRDRPSQEEIEAGIEAEARSSKQALPAEAPLRYIPGATASW